MEIQKKKLILGFTDRELVFSSIFLEINEEELINHYSDISNPEGRLLLSF